MELNSRQLMTLALPLVVTYLTWTAVRGQQSLLQALMQTQRAVAHHVAEVTPTPETLARDPFAPLAEDGTEVGTEGLLGTLLAGQQEASQEESEKPLRLDGTVIIGRRRLAIINGTRVVEGDRYLGLELVRVDADRVVLEGFDGHQLELYLEVASPETALPKAVPRGPASAVGKAQPRADSRKDSKGALDELLERLHLPRS
ncbi:MAG: hypothetical protein D6815_10025 [Candidatus Dadabacteria bacterium]|nr:MAG: hypothetical protein D6815_10025 [Candidatus Dadabacteria bacterium]